MVGWKSTETVVIFTNFFECQVVDRIGILLCSMFVGFLEKNGGLMDEVNSRHKNTHPPLVVSPTTHSWVVPGRAVRVDMCYTLTCVYIYCVRYTNRGGLSYHVAQCVLCEPL